MLLLLHKNVQIIDDHTILEATDIRSDIPLDFAVLHLSDITDSETLGHWEKLGLLIGSIERLEGSINDLHKHDSRLKSDDKLLVQLAIIQKSHAEEVADHMDAPLSSYTNETNMNANITKQLDGVSTRIHHLKKLDGYMEDMKEVGRLNTVERANVAKVYRTMWGEEADSND